MTDAATTTGDRPDRSGAHDPAAPRILTALPVFNEARHIPSVLAEVRRYSQDVLVVNDGSTDDTARVLADEPGIEVVAHERNRGYGAALATAFDFALRRGYDVLVTIDCDGQHQPSLIPALAAALDSEGEEWDIVSGSRYLQAFPGDSLPPADRRRINREITDELNRHFARLAADQAEAVRSGGEVEEKSPPVLLTDAFCGFKAYRVSSLRHFEITEFGYAMPLQVWIQAAAARLRIREFAVPLLYLDETRSFGGALDDAARRLQHYCNVLEREIARVGAVPRRSAACSERTAAECAAAST